MSKDCLLALVGDEESVSSGIFASRLLGMSQNDFGIPNIANCYFFLNFEIPNIAW